MHWQVTAELAIAETDTLRLALEARDTALVIVERSAEVWRLRAEVSEPRADSLGEALAELHERIATGGAPAAAPARCTLPGPFGRISCPSRRVAVAGAALLTLVAVRAVGR